MKKNALIVALCLCLVAVLACGTLAYFTAQDSVTNQFMTAAYDPKDPDPDPDDIFSIEVVEESEDDGEDETVVGTENKTTGGYDYTDLLPGSAAAKKVTVNNTGKYGAYVRVKVTLSKATEWKAILGDVNLLEGLADVDTANWESVGTPAIDEDTDTITYVYNYAKSGVGTVVAAGDPTEALFTKVTIPTSLDTEEFVTVDGFTVSVVGEAIQSEYLDTIEDAFKAFDDQNK